MKELIIQALDIAFSKAQKEVPLIKQDIEFIDIVGDIPRSLSEIQEYIKDNDLPEDAEFDWEYKTVSCPKLVPLSDLEKSDYMIEKFSTIAWKELCSLLSKNDYSLFEEIPDKYFSWINFVAYNNDRIYDSYVRRDWDFLLHFYSLYFKPNVSVDTTPSISNVKVYTVLVSDFNDCILPTIHDEMQDYTIPSERFNYTFTVDMLKEWQSQDSLNEHAKLFIKTAKSKGFVYESLAEFIDDLNYARVGVTDYYYFYTDKV